MSVINKMLRDLDRQQPSQHRGMSGVQPQHNGYRLVWLLAVPLALAAGWFGQSWYGNASSSKAATVVTVPEAPTEPVQKLAAAQATLALQHHMVAASQPQATLQPEPMQTDSKAAVATEKLQPFSRQPVAQARVIEVAMAPQPTQLPDPLTELSAAPAIKTVQVNTMSEVQSPDFPALENQWQDAAVEQKPRSLAIEKVQLTAAQQKNLLQSKAVKAEKAGNVQQAMDNWQQIRQLEPKDSQAYLELARLLQLQRNDLAAEQLLQQAGLAGIEDAHISMAQAALALKQQDWPKALTYLQYQPDIYSYPDFYALKATALQKTGQHAQAVQVFQQLARQQPNQARWWLGMALSYDALMQTQPALQAYRQAVVHGSTLSVASADYVKKRIVALE